MSSRRLTAAGRLNHRPTATDQPTKRAARQTESSQPASFSENACRLRTASTDVIIRRLLLQLLLLLRRLCSAALKFPPTPAALTSHGAVEQTSSQAMRAKLVSFRRTTVDIIIDSDVIVICHLHAYQYTASEIIARQTNVTPAALQETLHKQTTD